jgi:hypothetical protein
MANKISSAEQARDAVMRLVSKEGSRVLVEVSAMYLSFSVEGRISEFDGNILRVTGEGLGCVPPEISIAGLLVCAFDGDFREDDSEIFLVLTITRRFDELKIHIQATWRETPSATSTRVN